MDLKTSNSNNKNSIDNEKSTFEKIESEVKNTIFGVLFVLLKEEEMSIWATFIISIIQFFQILLFPFHSQIRIVWNSTTIADGIGRFVEFFQLVYYFKNTNWNVYIIMFYVGLAIVCLVILDVLYVSYSFNKKKFAFVWPLHALRSLCALFVTILFLPLLDYFVSVLGCIYDTKNNYVHHVFTEVVCWQGIYIVHAVLSILISITFIIISLIASITYFECRSTSSDPTARVNSRANFLFNFYEMVMIFSFNFMNGDQYQYILLALILGGSTILFVKFHFNSPYYNEIIAKLWSALMSINLWTAMMLVFAKIMENTLFEGSIIAWLIGIPFIILIVITNRDHRIDLLLINVNKFQNGQEIQNQIRYILKLISWQATNRNAAILLDGYIEIHKQTCNKDDCPLKQKVVKNNRLTKTLVGNEENMNEKYALLIQLLYKMYLYGIKKFPNNTSLRISYSFFLLEKMHSKQQALQELSQAEQNKPPFDEQFVIYRYKKIIEDEIAESQNEGTGGMDVVSEIAFQNHLRQCQANIEKSALQHMEFWSQLSEDNPDLGKLNDIGSNINSSVAHVEEHWNKLLKINRNMPRAMRMYGKFLIEIINDKETGEELLDQARNMMNMNSNKKAINMVSMNNNNDDFANEATPTVFISGEQEKFAFITGINLAAASLFGYNKTELINRKVNVLMPQVYSKFHDSFIESYLNNNETKLANTNKEKLVFGKNKSNYIFPVYITIKAVPSILQGIQFIATFRIEKNFKNAAYVLTHPDGSIDSISSSCINLLKVDLKMIMQKKSKIEDFVPNIMKDRQSLFGNTSGNNKAYATLSFNYPKDSEYVLDPNETSAQLNCYLFDVTFLSGKENGGLQFRFEKVIDKNTTVITGDRRAKVINFQFRYEKNLPKIIGEYHEGTYSDVNSAHVDHSEYNEDLMASGLRSNLGENDLGASVFGEGDVSGRKGGVTIQKPLNQQDPEVKKINYGDGIRPMRLRGTKVSDLSEFKDSEEAEEGEEGAEGSNPSNRSGSQQSVRKPEEDGGEEVSQKEFNTTFKSRKALNQVINDKRPPSSIRNLKWVANILIIILCVIAAADFAVTQKEFNDINDNLGLITMSNQKIAELQNIVARCHDLYLLNLGISPNGTTESTLKANIETSFNNVKSIVDTLQLNTLELSQEHVTLLQTSSIAMQLLVTADQTNTALYNLDQATLQVISKALNIINANITTMTSSNTDLYFILYNNFNDFYIGLRRSSELYVIELIERTITKETIFMVLLIVSAIALIIALVVLFPVLLKVNHSREEVLSLFLDIPEKTVKGLYTKCENFISNLQVGEDDDMVSEIDEESFDKNNEEPDGGDFHQRKRRKRFKNSGKSQRQFFIKFFIAACCIEAYFIADYFLSVGLLNQVNSIVDEYNSTSVAESFYSFVHNVERQMMINNKLSILKQDSQQVSVDNIKRMYYLDSEIHQEHSVNIQIHAQTYIDYFNSIMMSNPCGLLVSYVSTNSCTTFADGAVFQGMAVDLTRHFENLRYLLILYVNNYNNASLAFPDATVNYTSVYTPTNFGNNKQRNNWLNTLKTTQAVEVGNTQAIYIQNTFRLLMIQFKAGMDSIINKYITNRIILLIFFYVVLIGAYIVLWVPLVSKLNKDIWRTKSMLTMIPLNVVAKIRSVKVFLKKFWNERAIANY